MTAAVTYQFYATNYDRMNEAVANEPTVSRATEYYKENIGKVKSVDDLMADSQLYNYVMKAYGLEDMSYAKAFMRKVLEEGTDDDNAFANQLSDGRYAEMARDFNFVRYGEATTSFERTQGGVVDRYQRQSVEERAGADSTGARLALYFERRASEIDSPYDILADEALLQVVRTNLGFPAEMSYLDIETQAEMITERLNLEDLADPEYLAEFLGDFVVRWDVENPEGNSSVPTIAPLTSSGVQAISVDLLTSIQNTKLGT